MWIRNVNARSSLCECTNVALIDVILQIDPKYVENDFSKAVQIIFALVWCLFRKWRCVIDKRVDNFQTQSTLWKLIAVWREIQYIHKTAPQERCYLTAHLPRYLGPLSSAVVFKNLWLGRWTKGGSEKYLSFTVAITFVRGTDVCRHMRQVAELPCGT